MSITTIIHKISQTLARELDKAESPLTGTQLMALKAISDNDGCNQTLVVDVTGIDRSTLADVVRRLMRTGLISRKRSKADSRANVLTITDAGSRALAKADSARKKAEKEVIAQFPILRGLAA